MDLKIYEMGDSGLEIISESLDYLVPFQYKPIGEKEAEK